MKMKNKFEMSNGFRKKMKEINGRAIGSILQLRMKGAKIIRYNARGFGFQDIRKVFNQSEADDEILYNYYKKFLTANMLKNNIEPESEDEMVRRLVGAVNHRLTYQTDSKTFGRTEYWESSINIHKRQKDDCDGYAVLACYVLGLFGIDSWRRFVRAGDVYHNGTFGHATLLYLSLTDLEYYPLEGSFFPLMSFRDFGKVPFRTLARYGETWWLTNEKNSYSPNWIFKYGKVV